MNRRKFFKAVAAAGVAAVAPSVVVAGDSNSAMTASEVLQRRKASSAAWARICQQNLDAVTKPLEEAMLYGDSTLHVTDTGMRRTTVRMGLPKAYWRKMARA